MRCVLLVQREKSRWAWLIVWYPSVPVLLGRFLPQLLLWFVWEDGLFCKRGFGLNITSKSHLCSERSFYLCSACGTRLAVPALSEGFFTFPLACFVLACLLMSLSTIDRCRHGESLHQYERAEKEITGFLQLAPSFFHSHTRIKTRLHTQISHTVFIC